MKKLSKFNKVKKILRDWEDCQIEDKMIHQIIRVFRKPKRKK